MAGFPWHVLIACVILGGGAKAADSGKVDFSARSETGNTPSAYLPPFLDGVPERKELHVYGPTVERVLHTASGPGLESAEVGTVATFTIQLVEEGGQVGRSRGCWNVEYGCFIYVWIANNNHFFIAEVENNGDGTLTASYTGEFAGTYLIYIDDVQLNNKDRSNKVEHGRPIMGSPFEVEITGVRAMHDLDALPLCVDEDNGALSKLWRAGSWISSRVAGARHGVLRSGWVFQPESCAHETFSYTDLMAIANRDKPTWVLVLGGSVQRGIFLTLVDMVLAKGQKDNFGLSAIQKCWGWSDIRIGNLRLSYQDMRLWLMTTKQDMIVCNDEKLVSGGSGRYVHDAEEALDRHFFPAGGPWPDVIASPTHLNEAPEATNYDTEVMLKALPAEWNGKLVFLEHSSAYGFHWYAKNPTKKKWEEVQPYHGESLADPTLDGRIDKMQHYEDEDPRVVFMSSIPMNQAILFENQDSFIEKSLCYGCSQHYHRTSQPGGSESHNSSVMVQSMMTEMIGNVLLSMAVGSKEVLYSSLQGVPRTGTRTSPSIPDFEICTDCPRSLLPTHVKPVPEPSCATVSSLRPETARHSVWNKELCPEWCLNGTEPTGQTPTESGFVDVRECRI